MTSYVHIFLSPFPSTYMCPLHFPTLYPVPYLYLTNHAFHPTCSCFLQHSGTTALMYAVGKGHTDCVIALLASPDINVNHADVSIYLLTLSHKLVGSEGEGRLPHSPPHFTCSTYSLCPL